MLLKRNTQDRMMTRRRAGTAAERLEKTRSSPLLAMDEGLCVCVCMCVCSCTRIPAGRLTLTYTRSTASFKVWVPGVRCCRHRSPFLPHDPFTSYSPSGEGLRERSHLEASICQTPLALKSISDERGQNNC